MNDFLKSLTAFGMEGMNAEETVVEAYAGSECAEELIELDNLDNMTAAMESMADAIMENGLGAQTMALEAAGYSLDTASGFTGELSTEAIGNMVKRGYYEVKIQVKKAIEKLWKLVLALYESLVGSEGRLKSYGKLFKKYKERLSKVHPKEGKDGEDKEVTIREWDKAKIDTQLDTLTKMGGDWIKSLISGVKALDMKKGVKEIADAALGLVNEIYTAAVPQSANNPKAIPAEDKTGVGVGKKLNDLKTAANSLSNVDLGNIDKDVADAMEKAEKDFSEKLKDDTTLSDLKDAIKDMRDVDSDEMSIYDAKNKLYSLATTLEAKCKKDLKFKKNLISLRKAWDKKVGQWKLGTQDNTNTSAVQRVSSSVVRILGSFGSLITGYRLYVSSYYKAVASNLQGVLADMAKVIAKGTNIQR